MDEGLRNFLLCAPIYAPGLIVILVVALVWAIDRAARKKGPPDDKGEGPPGDGGPPGSG